MSLHLFAGLRVRDFQVARPWYERLLGDPAFFPHATEAVWTLAENRSVYVVEHADGAGNSVVTMGALSPSSQHSTILNSRWRSCDGEEAQGVLGG